ncbi:M23 family metallopeptidase [Sulfurovum sp. NBC37-1]|uniref:M23 family metallopeptidase n=1 Tax=Sulfurovum sp. (strain NBC37-1) TaxID=387093 RepID=UPI0001587D6D|nr:M23 family metallopeptidase [Sulfurovum sp. NBC37-1]BAF72920.1 peptidase, M23/M37 family [Sulfurovum sp. NBC37-1]
MAKKKRSGNLANKIFSVLLLAGVAAGAWYVYTAPEFERVKPKIESQKHIFWNRKDPLKVKVTDNVGLNSYEVKLSDGTKSVIIDQGFFDKGTKEAVIKVKYPKGKVLDPKAKDYKLTVTVGDSSMWNMMEGNKATKSIDVTVDYKRPNVNILSNSRMINQGGSALIVFQADDENMDELYVLANKNKFKPEPYKKEGYYAVLVAWPFTDNSFDAKIVATDLARNRRELHVPFYHGNPRYKTSHIKATDKFIDGKITDLASSDPEYAEITDKLKKLKAINETMRQKNEVLIHKLSKPVSNEMLDSWKIKKFYPLRNGKKVASFGDHRYYYYGSKDNTVSESYHVGYDLASNSMADIKASNSGKVVFTDDNGIYGNMLLIDHGLGLYTLYGHCSQFLVNEGDEVHAGQTIAKTGMTGLAMGDHLHFGMLVQGNEVRPVEWFDQSWINKFINKVFKQADEIISPPPVKEKRKK